VNRRGLSDVSYRWKMYNLLRCLVVFFLLAGLVQGEISPINCLGVSEEKPPAKPLHDIWIEGEDAVSPAGWDVMDLGDCYGGKEIVLLSKASGNYVLNYPFEVKASGTYLICVAGQSIGEG